MFSGANGEEVSGVAEISQCLTRKEPRRNRMDKRQVPLVPVRTPPCQLVRFGSATSIVRHIDLNRIICFN